MLAVYAHALRTVTDHAQAMNRPRVESTRPCYALQLRKRHSFSYSLADGVGIGTDPDVMINSCVGSLPRLDLVFLGSGFLSFEGRGDLFL